MLAIARVVNWNTFSRLAVYVEFVVDKVVQGRFSLRVLRFSFPQIFCTDSSITTPV